MKIDSTEFGSITVDDTTYAHDVLIRPSDGVTKRKQPCLEISTLRIDERDWNTGFFNGICPKTDGC